MNVTCPSCSTEQAVQGDAYVCGGCDTEWVFVRCGSCAGEFHARPGVSSWPCPNCGFQNGSARARPQVSRAMIGAGAGGVIVVAILAFALFSGGGDPAASPASTPSATGPLQAMCMHKTTGFEVFREDALRRAARTLEADAEALRESGDTDTAASVDAVVVATDDLVDAIAAQEDQSAQTEALLAALGDLPC
jgi:predicted RNA-binding Zn-ribbon protein involved in translation (DUF1610 family)